MIDAIHELFEKNTLEHFFSIKEKKRIVFWGAGMEAARAINNELADIIPDYFCDNNKSKWGVNFHGYKVEPPDALLNEDKNNLIVIVCSRLFLLSEIIKQLKEYSVEHYFSSQLFISEKRERYRNRFTGEYSFDDRRKNHKKLLIVLSGYKPLLWDIVFDRFVEYIPDDMDVCLVLSGVENDYLKELAELQGWSCLCTKENKLSLAQNIAIMLHDEAEMIYKIDEDIFIGKDYFERMESSYKTIMSNEICRMGFLSPILPVNIYSYIPFLRKMDLEKDFMERFGDEINKMGAWALHNTNEITSYLWDNCLPFDIVYDEIWGNKTTITFSPYRFSIGAILFHRNLWEDMFGFDVGEEGEMGNDEVHICNHCMEQFLAIYIDTNILAGHFAYGAQTKAMSEYYEKKKKMFEIQHKG